MCSQPPVEVYQGLPAMWTGHQRVVTWWTLRKPWSLSPAAAQTVQASRHLPARCAAKYMVASTSASTRLDGQLHHLLPAAHSSACSQEGGTNLDEGQEGVANMHRVCPRQRPQPCMGTWTALVQGRMPHSCVQAGRKCMHGKGSPPHRSTAHLQSPALHQVAPAAAKCSQGKLLQLPIPLLQWLPPRPKHPTPCQKSAAGPAPGERHCSPQPPSEASLCQAAATALRASIQVHFTVLPQPRSSHAVQSLS